MGRRVTITRNFAGVTSSRSETSSPILHGLAVAADAERGNGLRLDDDLDPLQMRRECLARPRRATALACRFRRFKLGLDRAEPGLNLVEGKGLLIGIELLGAAAEPGTLQLLDDRMKIGDPSFGAFVDRGQPDDLGLEFRRFGLQVSLLHRNGDEHRLQRVGVIRKGRSAARHDAEQKHILADLRPAFSPPESLRHGLSDRGRAPSPFGPNARPIHAIDERHQLRGGKLDHAVLNPRPAELVLIQPLGEQAKARPVPPHDLHPVGAFCPEHVKRAGERIGAGVAHQCRQTVRAFPEVDRTRRHIDLGSRGDHADRTARIASVRRVAATSLPTRIVAFADDDFKTA